MNAGDFLDRKGHDIFALDHNTTLTECARAMTEHRAGSMLILIEGRLGGIVTWRDVLAAFAQGGDVGDLQVSGIMTREVISTEADESMDGVARLMIRHNIHHMPIVSGERVLGVITHTDLFKHTMATRRQVDSMVEVHVSEGHMPKAVET